MARVAVALGSNLGDRRARLDAAVADLHTFLTKLRHSTWLETAPVDAEGGPFLNGAVVGETRLDAHAVLARLQAIEQAHGRTRPHPGAARTLDLDLIFYGDQLIDDPGLTVPHPRFRERRFVLAPLAEIAGEWIDPVTRRSVAALLAQLRV